MINKKYKQSIVFLLSRIKSKERIQIVVAFFMMIIIGWLTTRPPIIFGEFVTDQISGNKKIDFLNLGIILIIIFLAKEILVWLRKYISEKIATRIESDEYISAIDHILNLNIFAATGMQKGVLNYNLNVSIEGMVKLFKVLLLDFSPTLVIAIVSLFVVWRENNLVAIIFIVVAMITTIVSLWQVRSQDGIRVDLLDQKGQISASVVETMTGLAYLRASGALSYEQQISKQRAEELRKVEMRHHIAMMSFDAIKQFIEGIGFVLVVCFSIYLAVKGIIETGEVLTFTVLYNNFSQPVRDMHRIIDEGAEASAKVRRLEELYTADRDFININLTKQPEKHIEPSLNISNVSLIVSGNNIIRNFSYNFTGKRIGLIGSSGSGKSTLIKLCCGVYRNYDGQIYLGDYELNSLSNDQIAKYISYVPQDPFIKRASLRENLIYGCFDQNLNDEKIISNLKRVGLTELFDMDDSIDLEIMLEEGGGNLSGGQRQRIVLARELNRQRPIWVLDEPTSALDAENESKFIAALFEVTKGSTVIISGHRMSTLEGVDEIIEIEEGVIKKIGKFNDFI